MLSSSTKRNTLKDIAEKAGVAVVTVHKAIYNKAGISEQTRQKILQIVEDTHFSVNPIAASLKREAIQIAVVYPSLAPHLNYFYRTAAKGIDLVEQELANFRCSLLRCPCGADWESQAEILEHLATRNDINGVVIYCLDDTRLIPYFDLLRQKNIPAITFNADTEAACRIGSVTAPNERMGRLAAEFLCRLAPQNTRLVLFGGNRMLKNLRENSLGFFRYIQKERPDLSVLEINDFGHYDSLQSEIEHVLTVYPDISGVYCNSGRNDIPLCRAVRKLGFSGKLTVLANDVFEELEPYFQDNTLQATIWQDPQNQAAQAIRLMQEYLTLNKLDNPFQLVKISIVLHNNFEDFL